MFTHITLQSHYILLSCNIYHPFTDCAFNTSYREYLQTTVLHATIPFIIPLVCGIITCMSLIKQSDNAVYCSKIGNIHIMTHQSYIISSHHAVSQFIGIHVIIEDIALCIISTSSVLYALHGTKWASHHLCIVITAGSVQ